MDTSSTKVKVVQEGLRARLLTVVYVVLAIFVMFSSKEKDPNYTDLKINESKIPLDMA